MKDERQKGQEIFFKATDPAQYDSSDVRWEIEVGLGSPSRRFFYESLSPDLVKAKDGDVLEVGCGSGWLLNEIQKNGARSTIGIEPSKKNFELSKNNFPSLNVVNVSLEDFESNSHFDLVVSNMVFGHIKDLNNAFEKINSMLNPSGELVITVLDYDFAKQESGEESPQIEELDTDQYSISTPRDNGRIADVVRKVEFISASALRAGLKLVKERPLKPTSEFISSSPSLERFRDTVIVHLLKFKKVLNNETI